MRLQRRGVQRVGGGEPYDDFIRGGGAMIHYAHGIADPFFVSQCSYISLSCLPLLAGDAVGDVDTAPSVYWVAKRRTPSESREMWRQYEAIVYEPEMAALQIGAGI
jgi:hypothetical protein